MDRTGGTTSAVDADVYPSGLCRADVQEPLRVVRGRAMSQTQSNGPSRDTGEAVDNSAWRPLIAWVDDDGQPADDVLCVWCHQPLAKGQMTARDIECPCGIRYSRDIFESLGRDRWESIRRRDPCWNVRRDGSVVVVTDLHATVTTCCPPAKEPS